MDGSGDLMRRRRKEEKIHYCVLENFSLVNLMERSGFFWENIKKMGTHTYSSVLFTVLGSYNRQNHHRKFQHLHLVSGSQPVIVGMELTIFREVPASQITLLSLFERCICLHRAQTAFAPT